MSIPTLLYDGEIQIQKDLTKNRSAETEFLRIIQCSTILDKIRNEYI